MFCRACPAAPFIMLSIQDVMIARFVLPIDPDADIAVIRTGYESRLTHAPTDTYEFFIAVILLIDRVQIILCHIFQKIDINRREDTPSSSASDAG